MILGSTFRRQIKVLGDVLVGRRNVAYPGYGSAATSTRAFKRRGNKPDVLTPVVNANATLRDAAKTAEREYSTTSAFRGLIQLRTAWPVVETHGHAQVFTQGELGAVNAVEVDLKPRRRRFVFRARRVRKGHTLWRM